MVNPLLATEPGQHYPEDCPNRWNRRQFIRSLALTAAVAATQPTDWKAALPSGIGISPFIWTQQFKTSLGENLPEVFAATRRVGYTQIEMTPAFLKPDLRAQTRGLLKKHGFQVPMVYSRGTMHDDAGFAGSLSEIRILLEAVEGLECHALNLNTNSKRNHERKTDEDLRIQARNIDSLGRELQQRGMHLLIHNHNVEMEEHAREWRSILKLTDPALVGFCVDVLWVLRGGEKPLTLLHEAGKRIGALHLRNSKNGVPMEDLGPGDVDYRAVAMFLHKMHFSGLLLVELAYEPDTRPTRSLEEDLRLSRLYAEQIFRGV